jgi:hypothetical protein
MIIMERSDGYLDNSFEVFDEFRIRSGVVRMLRGIVKGRAVDGDCRRRVVVGVGDGAMKYARLLKNSSQHFAATSALFFFSLFLSFSVHDGLVCVVVGHWLEESSASSVASPP